MEVWKPKGGCRGMNRWNRWGGYRITEGWNRKKWKAGSENEGAMQ